MGTTRAVGVLAGGLAGTLGAIGMLAAQQPQAARRPVALPAGGLARYDVLRAPSDPKLEPIPAVEAVGELLRAAIELDRAGGGAQQILLPKAPNGRPFLIVVGTAEQNAAVREAMAQLELSEPLRARLQVSLLTLPATVAREQGLVDGKTATTTEAAAGGLARVAVKHGGSLRNLPEVVVHPLLPFVVVAGKPVAAERALQVRGEMVPLTPSKVGIGMQLVRGPLPEDPTRPPAPALATPVFRLEAGTAELTTLVERDVATVLVVRCIDLVPAPLPEPPAKR